MYILCNSNESTECISNFTTIRVYCIYQILGTLDYHCFLIIIILINLLYFFNLGRELHFYNKA